MSTNRRGFLYNSFWGVAAASVVNSRAAAAAPDPKKLGIPGPYPGRVIAVEHPGCIVSGAYQPDAVRGMMRRGMQELTNAPGWQDAWRSLFEKGDVVGIKVSPVGGPKLSSDASVLHSIIEGLNAAGVPNRDIIVFNRYRQEAVEAGIDKWIPQGVRFDAASPAFDFSQLGMNGYAPDQYMELAIVKDGDNPNDPHSRRSYLAKIVSTQVNKVINLPVLKHHQSAGVTIALKNMSHGFVNNVNRSHMTPTANACGIFIPTVVSMPVIRQKVVLHIVDAVKASYHGGPPGKERYIWEPKTLYFGTDPVALDKTGWKVIDAKRKQVGMASVALSKPDADSGYLNCQVEHIEISGMMGLGEFDDAKIRVKQVRLA